METTVKQRLAIAKLMGWEYISQSDHNGKPKFMWGWFARDKKRIAPHYSENLLPLIDGGCIFPNAAEAMQALDAWTKAGAETYCRWYILRGDGEKYDCQLIQGGAYLGNVDRADSRRDAIVAALLQAMGVDHD